MSSLDRVRLKTDPIAVKRSRYNIPIAALTSLPAGKCVPIAAIPMLREDGLSARLRINTEMLETAEILMNPVVMRVTAYVVPYLAFPQFQGSRDQFERSYMKQPQSDNGGAPVVPFFNTWTASVYGGMGTISGSLGHHYKSGQTINLSYMNAYNLIWNMRAKNRSLEIEEVPVHENVLRPAFWNHSRFAHVVPDFDQAVLDGEVPLTIVDPRVPISGIGKGVNGNFPQNGLVRDSSGAVINYPHAANVHGGGNDNTFLIRGSAATNGFPEVFAELQQHGLSVSLANIDMAKEVAAFARLREQYEGHDDDYIIDMLVERALTIPDQHLKQPILLADRTVRFGQAKRYASDAGNLAESAVSGAASMDINVRVPRLATGGIVMVIAEVYPEQLFERSQDWLLHMTDQDELPQYFRDYTDPEKVDIITNGEVDNDHANPADTFGYWPLNAKFAQPQHRIGNKFMKSVANPGSDTIRRRIWAMEQANPVLGEDFYLVKNLHLKPFLNSSVDQFETTVVGSATIEGNTVFGGALHESNGSYQSLMDKVEIDRIEKE